jgi:hypothetical protein
VAAVAAAATQVRSSVRRLRSTSIDGLQRIANRSTSGDVVQGYRSVIEAGKARGGAAPLAGVAPYLPFWVWVLVVSTRILRTR